MTSTNTRAELEGAIKQARERLSEEKNKAKKKNVSTNAVPSSAWNGNKIEHQLVPPIPKVSYSSKLQQAKDGGKGSKRITPTPATVARTQSSLFASGSEDENKTRIRSEMLSDLFAIKPTQKQQGRKQQHARKDHHQDDDSKVAVSHHQQQQHQEKKKESDYLSLESLELSPDACAVARSHAESLKAGLVPNTHQEMRTLFEAISLHALVQNSSPGLTGSLLIQKPKAYAPAYCCLVLEEASELVLQMGERVLEAMAESSAVKSFAPMLRRKVVGKLDSIRSSRLRYKSFYDELPQQGNPAIYLRRPMVLPGGESRPLNMLPNEAKRLKNREEARDSFVNLLGNLQDFLNKHDLLNSNNNNNHGNNSHQKKYTYDDYEALHNRIRLFSSTLHIDNIQWFSQLFMERILQTASMGEMDEEVVVLANADPSKMRRLHQRMTISNGRGGANKSQQGSSFGTTDYHNSSSNQSKRHHHNNQRTQLVTQLNGPSGMELIRSILINFPINLRIYTLFLLIADSQRLNEQLESKMLKRIFDLATWLSSPMPHHADISERVLSCKALALFLGYFAFCCKDKACVLANDMLQQIGKKQEEDSSNTKFLQCRSLLDVSRLIECSLGLGTLPFTLPWISDYLQLAKYSERDYNEELRSVLSQLWSLRSSLSVKEHLESFGTAALCMRICIDNLFQEWRIDVQNENVGKFFQELELEQPAATATMMAQNLKMNVANNMLDQKCIQACCPELDDLAALMDEISLNAMNAKPSLRKITPVTPAKNEARKAVPNDFNIDSNKTLRAALLLTNREESQESRDKGLTLQRAMLDRYPELKNAIDFVVDAVARNAVDETIGTGGKMREECMKALALGDKDAAEGEWNTNERYKSIAISSFQQIRSYVEEKVPMALQVLSPANLDARVANCAVEIGVEASLITAAKRLLDRIPLEYQKCSREKVRAAMDSRKKRMSMPAHAAPECSDLSELAAHVFKSCMLDKACDSQEEVTHKVRSIAFQLNASLNVLKKSKYPSLPLTDEYHSLWRDGSPLPDCMELLGYVWSDLLFVRISKELDKDDDRDIERAVVALSGEVYGHVKESVFDQLDLSSTQPPVCFALGIVSKLVDTCSLHLLGVLKEEDLSIAESCTVEILSSLLTPSSGTLLHPRDMQEILIRLLDDPASLGQYPRARDERDSELYKTFVSKYLQREEAASLYFAQVLPKLSS